jgi:nitrate reductase assembly molybdenum cofactor insertion protein NarJ
MLTTVCYPSEAMRQRLQQDNEVLQDTVKQLEESLKQTLDECQQLEDELHQHQVRFRAQHWIVV